MIKDFFTNHPVIGGLIVLLLVVSAVSRLFTGPEKRRKTRRNAKAKAVTHAKATVKPKPEVAAPEKVLRAQGFGRNAKNGQPVSIQPNPAVPGRVPLVLPPRDDSHDLLDKVVKGNMKVNPDYDEPQVTETAKPKSRKDKARNRRED